MACLLDDGIPGQMSGDVTRLRQVLPGACTPRTIRTMSAPEPYRIKMLRRARLQGHLFRVGEIVTVQGPTALRGAAGLVATAQARPADERTARDVALYRLTR